MGQLAVLKRVARRAGLRRSRIASLRMCGERTTLATFGRGARSERGRILCYHSVGTPQWGVNDVSPDRFRRHLELALRAGYRFVPAETIACGNGRPRDLALTFDDGLTSVATNAAPILAEHGIPWTLFVVSDWAEGRHSWGEGVLLGWREIELLAGQGVSIGSHSVSHPNFSTLAAGIAHHELNESRRMIEMRLGIAPTAFAIPMGKARDWSPVAQSAAQAAGYTLIYAQSADRRARGTIPRTFITRFDNDRIFHAALKGAFDSWEEWV